MSRYSAEHLEEVSGKLYKWAPMLYWIGVISALLASWRVIDSLDFPLSEYGLTAGVICLTTAVLVAIGVSAALVNLLYLVALFGMRTAEADRANALATEGAAIHGQRLSLQRE